MAPTPATPALIFPALVMILVSYRRNEGRVNPPALASRSFGLNQKGRLSFPSLYLSLFVTDQVIGVDVSPSKSEITRHRGDPNSRYNYGKITKTPASLRVPSRVRIVPSVGS